jgi:hypothetical protein
MRRAAICVGVDKALPDRLRGAAAGARQFARWAEAQGCQTVVFADETDHVTAAAIFKAIDKVLERGADQLIVYFAGHGVATSPYGEKWLLSEALHNENECVNLRRCFDFARRSGVPHVVFVSDCCRTNQANDLQGSNVFPRTDRGGGTEIDVFYATRPGDPAYEVGGAPEAMGIFTHVLLQTVLRPDPSLIDTIEDGGSRRAVVTSRKLKPYLEENVPLFAGDVDIKLSRQVAELLVQTALPKFFARVFDSPGAQPEPPLPLPLPSRHPERPRFHEALDQLSAAVRNYHDPDPPFDAARAFGFEQEINNLISAQQEALFDVETGISVRGAVPTRVTARYWDATTPVMGASHFQHVRLQSNDWKEHADTAVLDFAGGGGTAIAVVPQHICAVIVQDGRVVSVQYVPSPSSALHDAYREAPQIDRLRALVAVAARNGRFVIPAEDTPEAAGRIRPNTAFDPTLGIYAAYAYASVGRFADVERLLGLMREEPPFFVPFDVLMLAGSNPAEGADRRAIFYDYDAAVAPNGPMFTEGWAVLDEHNPVWQRDVHARLRRHLTPSLWTSFTSAGVSAAVDALGAVATA